MAIFKKVAIIQIRTPISIHLPKTEGYNQNCEWNFAEITKQEEKQ